MRKTYFQSAIVTLSFLISTAAMAGTIFAPRATRDDSSNGDYPPSSFGQPPVNGFSQGFAAREVMDMDSPDEESGRAPRGSRGLASVGDSPISITQAAPAGTQDIPPSVVARRGVQEVSVIASDLGYFPKTIFVTRSVPVRLYVTSASKNTLCIMMDSFQVRKQVKSGKIQEITFLPNVPGKYRYYCPVNGMEGTMIVKDFSSDDYAAASSAETSVPYQPSTPAAAPTEATTSARGLAGESSVGHRVPSVQAQWESNSAIDPNE